VLGTSLQVRARAGRERVVLVNRCNREGARGWGAVDTPCVVRGVFGVQIFGNSDPGSSPGVGAMDGFVTSAVENGLNVSEYFRYFTSSEVPVISTLASTGLAFQEWFCSVPGPTIPNRLYHHSGTSYGDCDDNVLNIALGYPQPTIYDVLSNHSLEWRAYFGDISDVLVFASMRSDANLARIQYMDQFYADAAAGNLTSLSYISPVFDTVPELNLTGSDQHPSHDVIQGELLLRSVYQALRSSPAWNETLLIVTYDEHGGFFDTIPPPGADVPSPDGIACDASFYNFSFTRQGVRIPFIAVSPWLDQGVMLAPPADLKPAPSSSWDATSYIATLFDIFNINATLSARQAWAPSFAPLLLQRSSPRTDLPAQLPIPPPGAFDVPHDLMSDAVRRKATAQQPMSELQRALQAILEGMLGESAPEHPSEAHAGLWAHHAMERILQRSNPTRQNPHLQKLRLQQQEQSSQPQL
jgi:phospholipase C